MNRIPRFIPSDKVCLKQSMGNTIMYIQKFKTVLELQTNRRIYTGLVYCYWFEGKYPRKQVFHEDELEAYKMYV